MIENNSTYIVILKVKQHKGKSFLLLFISVVSYVPLWLSPPQRPREGLCLWVGRINFNEFWKCSKFVGIYVGTWLLSTHYNVSLIGTNNLNAVSCMSYWLCVNDLKCNVMCGGWSGKWVLFKRWNSKKPFSKWVERKRWSLCSWIHKERPFWCIFGCN